MTVGDLEIAGGLLLPIVSVHDRLHPELAVRQPAFTSAWCRPARR